jgi:PAS domain S-box-containing protein
MDWRNIREKITAAYVEFDRDWRYIYVNPSAVELLGHTAAGLIGTPLWAAFPKLIGTDIEREFRRAMDENVDVRFSCFSPVLERWLEIQAISSADGICVFFHDISKHKQAHAELQTLLDVVPVGIAVAYDPECTQIRLNPTAAKMLGVDLTDNVSKNGPDAARLPFRVMQNGRELAPDELPMQTAAARNAQLRDVELEIVRDNGRVVNLFECASPLLDEQNNVRGCVGVFVDISERKRAERQLQAIYELTSIVGRAERIEEVFEATLDALEQVLSTTRGAILMADPGGVMRFKASRGLSEQYRKRVDGSIPWPLGETPAAVFVPNLEESNCGPLKPSALEEGIRSLAYIPLVGERRLIGKFTVYFNHPRVYTDAEKSMLHTIGYHVAYAIERRVAEADRLRLLERERQAREEAERANRLKDEFLAVVSHEIRTPLNAITGWCHLLKSGKLDDDGFHRAIETITRNARSQAQLIDDILDVSRIIAGKLQLQKMPVLLQQIVQAAIDSVRPAAGNKRIDLNLRLPQQGVTVLGDAIRLQQVVTNILSNAVKFSVNGGRIDVFLDRDAAFGRIIVSDNGQGIDPEFLPHVFERFRQGDGSATRKHGGLGLGLAIAKHIVELHAGSISVYSDGPGCGARVTIYMPAIAGPSMRGDPGSRRSESIPSRPLAGVRILAVEDHADTLDLFANVLEREMAVVRRCSSASEALGAIGEFKPDMVVADIAMPGEDGCALLRELRTQGQLMPAIAVTACVRPEDRARIIEAGFDFYLPKPVEPDVLVRALAQVRTVRAATSSG